MKIPSGYKIPLLVYHSVSEIPFNIPIYSIEPDIMQSHIEILLDSGYNFITFDDLPDIERIKKPILLTYDDGYEDNYNYLFPILKKYNVKATIAIVLNNIGVSRYLNQQQIKTMFESKLVSFQSHTLSHIDLNTIDESQIEFELSESKSQISKLIKKEPVAIFYPYGSYSANVLKIAEKYYEYGVTANSNCWVTGNNDYAIGRLFVGRGLPAQELLNQLSSWINQEN